MFSRKHESESVRVIFDGNLYDVSEFVKIHPGGESILRKYRGRNVSDVMTDPAIHKHSQAALAMLKQYHVGTENELKTASDGIIDNLNNNDVSKNLGTICVTFFSSVSFFGESDFYLCCTV